eukprot:gb/GFBE01054840.1/.p1 GENE.gb/GFBE01054840.1/~~gb/GFBE01054840.1/.p1  ORF type:complete len:467 (+),score=95.89 gb/GFBE01054840.1/:1-1401(+)
MAPKSAPTLTMLSQARARALLTELIVGFSTRPFQKQLDDLVHAHVAAKTHTSTSAAAQCTAPTEIFQLEGRKELALTVQREILPRYGFDGSESGVAEMVRSVQPFLSDARTWALAEAIKRKLRMPSKTALDSDSEDEMMFVDVDGSQEAQPRRLRRDKAVALQTELLQEYTQPEFQVKLREVMRIGDKEAQRAERKRLIREVQAAVMPRYGFEATDEGIKSMQVAFEPWNDDDEVQTLQRAMEEQLTLCISDVMAQTLEQRKVTAAGAVSSLGRSRSQGKLTTLPVTSISDRGPATPSVASPPMRPRAHTFSTLSVVSSTTAATDPAFPPLMEKQDRNPPMSERKGKLDKETCVSLLSELLSAFSTSEFQSQVRLLKRGTTGTEGASDEFRDGCTEIALAVQVRVIVNYGFSPSREGVLDMICECSLHIKDPEVSKLNDAINGKLGKDVAEQSRFRKQLQHINSLS